MLNQEIVTKLINQAEEDYTKGMVLKSFYEEMLKEENDKEVKASIQSKILRVQESIEFNQKYLEHTKKLCV
jgi:hypothetical protein